MPFIIPYSIIKIYCDQITRIIVLYIEAFMDTALEMKFNSVYYKYKDLLFGVIFAYTKDEDDTYDILMDTFLSFIDKMSGIKEEKYKYYLVRCAINKSLNFIKKKKRENTELDLSYLKDDRETEDLKIIYNEVLKLDPIYKDVIILHYYYDFSIKEISDTLKVKESAVKMRLERARNTLKERLKNE